MLCVNKVCKEAEIMRRRERSVWMVILVGLLGLIVGYFIGMFFVYLSDSVAFLSFLSVFDFSTNFGLDTINLNLIFLQLSFGFTIRISVMGVVTAIVFLIIYFRRR